VKILFPDLADVEKIATNSRKKVLKTELLLGCF
jgi:hypothetical protein